MGFLLLMTTLSPTKTNPHFRPDNLLSGCPAFPDIRILPTIKHIIIEAKPSSRTSFQQYLAQRIFIIFHLSIPTYINIQSSTQYSIRELITKNRTEIIISIIPGIFLLQIKHMTATNRLISPGAYSISNINKTFHIAKIVVVNDSFIFIHLFLYEHTKMITSRL